MKFALPECAPGMHPPTAALMNILASKGFNNPVTEAPFSEALLLGVGGGLDAGYILFQFDHLPHPMLVLGFRNQWNNTQAFLENLTDRLRFNVQFSEFDEADAAQKALQDSLKQGKKAIVWVDKAHLPYHQLPEHFKGLVNHQVAVHTRDGRLWKLFLDDLSSQPIELREKIFTDARANLSQRNFLMMIFNGGNDLNVQELQEAIIEGIKDCATRLTRPIKTIGISNLETWAQMLTDRHDKQSWPQIFKDQKGLFPALVTLYETIKLNGTEGFALRRSYSDFLHEAAGILNNPLMNAAAGQYLQLSTHWSSLAENALPSKIPVFDRVKKLLNKKYRAYREHQFKVYNQTATDLQALEEKILSDFPLDSFETSQLYERLSSQIKLIAELETSAAYRLRDITRR